MLQYGKMPQSPSISGIVSLIMYVRKVTVRRDQDRGPVQLFNGIGEGGAFPETISAAFSSIKYFISIQTDRFRANDPKETVACF